MNSSMRRALASLMFALAAVATPAAAQVFPFQIKVQQDDNVAPVDNGSIYNINAKSVNQATTVHVTATYRGFGTVDLASMPALVGPAAFTLTGISNAPGTLVTGDSFKFDVTYTPATSAAAGAQVQLVYRESTISNDPTIKPVVTPGLFIVNFLGTAPELTVSYLLPADGNSSLLPDGSKLVFPSTPVNGSSTVQVTIANRGSGSGKITGITVSGSAFQPQGIPLFPVTIGANQQFSFNIRYSPLALETSTGALSVVFDSSTVNVGLSGTSVGTTLVYQVSKGSQTTAIVPGQTIAFDSANIGDSTSAVIQVRNAGTADGTITGIGVTGAGYQLGDVPTFPVTLSPGAVTSFTINFTPTQPGQFPGHLRVGNDNFDLSATGLGSRLTFSYLAASTPTTVTTGGSVIFSPLAAGKKTDIPFTVQNVGTSPATIANIGIQEASAPFTLSGLPSLPLTLQPNDAFTFTVTFSPVTTGFVTANLRIDTNTFVLSGSGTLPQPLPNFTLTGPSGVVAPLQQPAVTLTLASPYPVTVSGVLTLSVAPEGFATDPAIQFSTGGLTANFTIPANTTQAMFGTATQVRLQTGSIAAHMTITPSFSLPGGVDITPASPQTLQFSVASAAPVLTTLQVSTQAATGFTLIITGVATSRSLTRLDFTVTPASSRSVSTTKFSADLTALAAAWFNSSASQASGGQFQISIPFFLSSGDQTTSPLSALAAIAVTATNEKGTSNSLSTGVSAQ